jgi:hypothetical protein
LATTGGNGPKNSNVSLAQRGGGGGGGVHRFSSFLHHLSLISSGATAYHVLVAAADICSNAFEDHAVWNFAAHVGRIDPRAVSQLERRVFDVADFYLAWLDLGDTLVARYGCTPIVM